MSLSSFTGNINPEKVQQAKFTKQSSPGKATRQSPPYKVLWAEFTRQGPSGRVHRADFIEFTEQAGFTGQRSPGRVYRAEFTSKVHRPRFIGQSSQGLAHQAKLIRQSSPGKNHRAKFTRHFNVQTEISCRHRKSGRILSKHFFAEYAKLELPNTSPEHIHQAVNEHPEVGARWGQMQHWGSGNKDVPLLDSSVNPTSLTDS